MWMLALDSSTEWCSVAVGDGRRWHVRDEHAGQAHSERLLPMVREVLAEAGLALGQLDGIAFGAGPGSFTGIRIGCGVAQGLAFGADLAVVAVPTLEALAHEARRTHGWTSVVACLDARMREVYAGMYAADGDAWRAVMVPVAAAPATLQLPAPHADACGAGNGFAAYPALAKELELAAVDATLRPTAQSIGELALPRLAAGEGVAAALALPLYVRHRVALTTAERDAGARL
ncbi:MAG: tRNA (adenosine(37)-N6)-threonylcarbamoyltransferase complex dimerization subunit type 1 TsaB [Casimicrobiaceae bacterium]